MGLVDDKKNVFTTIGAYTSLREQKNLPDTTNLYPSVNNKKDISSFLLDVLGVVVGTTAMKQLTGELFTNFTTKAEPVMKSSMNKQLIQQNSGSALPNSFKSGTRIPVSSLDSCGKLKNSTTSQTGSLLYDNGNNFDRASRNAIANPGVGQTYNNLIITYDDFDDSLVLTPTAASSNDDIGTWFNNYVEGTTFIGKKSFSSSVLNSVFGSITTNEDKNVNQILNCLVINEMLKKMMDDDDADGLDLDSDTMERLESLAQQYKDGSIKYDMGCGEITSDLSIDELTDLVNDIVSSDDPNYVSNQIDNTLGNSFNTGGDSDNQSTSEENAETIRNGFFERIIQAIRMELSKALTISPQARMLLALSSSFQNGGNTQISTPQEDMENFKVTIKCLMKEMLALLYEFIFNLILTFLIALIAPIIKKIIKEKINQFINIIKSLISSRI